jgi:flavin reductase (DIM6/NTAB) family NADH-FMN oxidoreductase RutF
LSILSLRQQFLADRFAGLAPLAPARFQGIDHITAVTGCPLLTGSIGWADCKVVDTFVTGDHVNFLGEVQEAGQGLGRHDEPLINFQGRYARMR